MLSGWSASSYRNTAQLSAISAQVTTGVPRLGIVSRRGIMRSPCKNTPRNHCARGKRMTTVAFIGLGAMGSRMAMNLHAAGFKLQVFNRDRAKARPFAEKGIAVAGSPAEAAKGAEFVVSIVADDNATREVMLGASGIIGAAAPGTIVIDSSTNTAAMAREVAKAAAARGIAYLDSPVSGSLPQAQAKELVIMVGGDQAAFDKAQPVYAGMGRLVRHIGGSGSGATLKLINNMLGAALQAALAEG